MGGSNVGLRGGGRRRRCRKVRRTECEAKAALASHVARGTAVRGYYFCRWCDAWHLTKNPERKSRRQLRRLRARVAR